MHRPARGEAGLEGRVGAMPARGAAELGHGGEIPQGSYPNLDAVTGTDEFTSPELNPDGNWIRLEDRRTGDSWRDERGYSYSVFHNRFRVRRAEGRDEIVRREVRRSEARTRPLGDGTCVTEQDVTYENRLQRAYILDQAYDYVVVDENLEGYYEFFNSTGATVGSLTAATAGGEVATGFVTGVGAGAGTMTIGGALLVGGATFVSVTQAMSELKSAANIDHSGWMPILWFFERDQLPDDTDPLTVTETISIHPCERPVTGSPPNPGQLAVQPTFGDGFQPLEVADETTPGGLPNEESDIVGEPDVAVDADEVPEDNVPEIERPTLTGSGDDRRSPDFEADADWYRDLGRRGGYYFVVQFLNRFREVPDLRFEEVVEELVPTNRYRTRHLGGGRCQQQAEYLVHQVEMWGVRVDQAYQVWRVDSEEAVVELKRALREAQTGDRFTQPTESLSSTASAATGTYGNTLGVAALQLGKDAPKSLKLASAGFGWVSNIITIMNLPTDPVPAGAGWMPVGFYRTHGRTRPGESTYRWVDVGDAYPCPDAPAEADDEVPILGVGLSFGPRSGTGLDVQYAETVPDEPATSGDGSGLSVGKLIAAGLFALAAVVIGIIALTGGSDDSDPEATGPGTGTDADPTDRGGVFTGTEAMPFGPIAPADALPGAFVMPTDVGAGSGSITGGTVRFDDDGLTVSIGYEIDDPSTLRFGFTLAEPDGTPFLEASIGQVDGMPIEGGVTIHDGDTGVFTWPATGSVGDGEATLMIDLDQPVPAGWQAPTGPIRGYATLDRPPSTDAAAFDRATLLFADVAGWRSLQGDADWLPAEDQAWIERPLERLGRLTTAGFDEPTAQCIVDTVPVVDEIAASFRPDAQEALILPCVVRLSFGGTPTALAAESGGARYAGEDGLSGCLGEQLSETVTTAEEFAAISNPDYASWPDGLVSSYAAALERCAPLRPYYEAWFASFEPYTRDGCVDDMTDYVLGTYSWEVFIIEGLLDPDPAVQAEIQSIFDTFVNQGYGLQECFAAG